MVKKDKYVLKSEYTRFYVYLNPRWVLKNNYLKQRVVLIDSMLSWDNFEFILNEKIMKWMLE